MLAEDLVGRRIATILAQSRNGVLIALLLAVLAGFVYVPAVGWPLYLAWYAVLAAAFIGRQFYFKQVLRRHGETQASLFRIAAVSALTGWLAIASLPLFSRFLAVPDIAIMTTIMVSWLAVAVSILSVQPRVYRTYLAVCLVTIFTAWFGHGSVKELVMLGVGMALGGLMLSRLANLVWDQQTAVAERERALTDTLTLLPNREGIRAQGDAMLNRGLEPILFVVEINRFKAINDALGYEFGDAVLLETARRLASIPGVQAGRLHATQFCLLSDHAGIVASLRGRIDAAFAEQLHVNGEAVDIDLAVGVAISRSHGDSMSMLIRNAAIAANAAQRVHEGWMVYADGLTRVRRADLILLSELKNAVTTNELRLYLQPKVSLADGHVRCAEALVRWEHPTRGLVPPSEFVPFAEQTGSIRLLTQWMLREAMKLVAGLSAQGLEMQVSVNISINDLRDASFVATTLALAREWGAEPRCICLEVTESSVMDDPASMMAMLHQLREAGFSLSIDDFGTGYSSLAYLQKMPVSELKIDRAFVRGVQRGSGGEMLLDSICALGHRMGLKVVAEGVETADEWALVKRLGCDMVQGWYAEKPMPIAAFMDWRAKNDPFIP